MQEYKSIVCEAVAFACGDLDELDYAMAVFSFNFF